MTPDKTLQRLSRLLKDEKVGWDPNRPLVLGWYPDTSIWFDLVELEGKTDHEILSMVRQRFGRVVENIKIDLSRIEKETPHG